MIQQLLPGKTPGGKKKEHYRHQRNIYSPNSFRTTSAAKSTSFSVLKIWQEKRIPLNHCLCVARILSLYLSYSILLNATFSIRSGNKQASIGEASGPAGGLTIVKFFIPDSRSYNLFLNERSCSSIFVIPIDPKYSIALPNPRIPAEFTTPFESTYVLYDSSNCMGRMRSRASFDKYKIPVPFGPISHLC